MNINRLNVTQNDKTTPNETKKKLYIQFDIFKTQTESFCTHHCKAVVLIYFDSGVMHRFDFSMKNMVEDLSFF